MRDKDAAAYRLAGATGVTYWHHGGLRGINPSGGDGGSVESTRCADRDTGSGRAGEDGHHERRT